MPSPERPRAVVSWSGGKDCAWALEQVRENCEILALIATVDEGTGRVPIHNVSGGLLQLQAESLSVPLWTVPLPSPCHNAEYLRRLKPVYARAFEAGARSVVYGDLFLKDIRAFREASLQDTGLTPVFPLWEIPTAELARRMMSQGIHAVITCVDLGRLPATYAGSQFDPRRLPPDIDPCGENGEFHTFVSDGPMFRVPVRVAVKSVCQDERFAYADLAYADLASADLASVNQCPESFL